MFPPWWTRCLTNSIVNITFVLTFLNKAWGHLHVKFFPSRIRNGQIRGRNVNMHSRISSQTCCSPYGGKTTASSFPVSVFRSALVVHTFKYFITWKEISPRRTWKQKWFDSGDLVNLCVWTQRPQNNYLWLITLHQVYTFQTLRLRRINVIERRDLIFQDGYFQRLSSMAWRKYHWRWWLFMGKFSLLASMYGWVCSFHLEFWFADYYLAIIHPTFLIC